MKKLRAAIKNTKQLAIKGDAHNVFEQPSFEKLWNVENCAEVWSVRKAIMNGAEWKNISFKCINIGDGAYWKPCKNCEETFKELIKDKGEK